MRLYRHANDLPPAAKGAVACLGNFDGVHLGHRAVIGEGARIARATGRNLAVVTFEPHTREFFEPDAAPFRLTPLRAKLHALDALGVDLVVALAFNRSLSQLSAEAFGTEVLARDMAISHAVAGSNFRYGHRHAGSMEMLAEAGACLGFGVTAVPEVRDAEGTIYSATRIRQLVAAGDLRAAAALLGRPWEVDGHVIGGDRRGRLLGFPTANMHLGDYLRPAFGIYAVRARLDRPGAPWIDGVANLGIRPMWRTAEPMVETHLFDFSDDIYGEVLRVRLIERLRGEAHFDSIDALVEQVDRDKLAAKQVLASN
jgi:riboflavin kinase/FMN adenylyltransferase